MTTTDAAPRRRARSIVPAIVVSAVVGGVLLVPQLLPFTGAPQAPVFPRSVAAYSWWTTPLGAGEVERATVVYQNGVGVEFLDIPQAVVLGDDGSTYRRLPIAEGRSTAMDQGDPARTLLSPDGTFVVVASGTQTGLVTIMELSDGSTRDLPIGDGRSAVPQSITADGRTALLLAGDAPMSRYADPEFQLNGALLTLDLLTGEVTEHPTTSTVHAAAISPDGGLILLATTDGPALLDVASGEQRELDVLEPGSGVVGAAFSPSGALIASPTGTGTGIRVDGVRAGDEVRSWPLPGFEYAAPVGWRDEDTVLVQGTTDSGANTSAFAWVDVVTGAVETFSTYQPDATGAAMWVTSVASDLIPDWTIADTRSDRGILPLMLAAGAALGAGVIAWLLTPRRRVREAQPPADEHPQPVERVASVV